MVAADHETRISEDDHQALRLWLRLLTCSNLVQGELRSLLRTEFQSTLPRFDLLAQLERSPKGLTMGELSKRMMVSCGNVTGIVNQLVQEEMVSRTAVPNNRRTFIVKLTPKGKRYFKKMANEHESWIVRLLNGLDPEEMQQCMQLLGKLKTHINEQLSK
jgi:DNA-binding MarR family transcriptional regulator